MPDTAINTARPLRLEQGGKLILTDVDDSSASYEIQNRETGTVQIKDGWYTPLRYNNKGEMQVPVEGDEQPSTGRFTVKLTSLEAAQLAAIVQQRGTLGRTRRFGMEIRLPTYKGATTGHTASIGGVYVTSFEIAEGQEFDTVTVEVQSAEPKWTLLTYVDV